MTSSALIELNDDELLAVSGGVGPVVVVGIAQLTSQSAAIIQEGGSAVIGGYGNGATSFTGNLTFTQSFAASIGQGASNVNAGSVTAGVAVS